MDVDKNWGGSVVKSNFEEIEENTREVRSRSMGEKFVVCLQVVVEKNIFLVQFVDGNKKEMSYILFLF